MRLLKTQHFFVRSNNDSDFNIFIDERKEDSAYDWSLHVWNKRDNYSAGKHAEEMFSKPENVFKDFLTFVVEYLSYNSDSVKYLDNPCNCELVDSPTQKRIINDMNQSFQLRVNGKNV